MSPANTGLGRQDSRVVLSQHAVVSGPALHVNLLLSHYARLALYAREMGEKHFQSTNTNTGSTFMHGMDLDFYLVVQVPGLIVFLCAFPAEDGLVVYLDELPFGTVAKVSKKAARGKRSEWLKLCFLFIKCHFPVKMHIVTLKRITSTLNDTVLPKRFASIWQQGKIANMKSKRARN